jgi:DNA-3-methyladenine glycosylase II
MDESLTFHLVPRGPFSLAAASEFLHGFRAAVGSIRIDGGHIHLAFVPDGAVDAVGVCLRAADEGVEVLISGGGDVEAIPAQVGRILSLDIDARGYPEIGRRDPVVGELQERYTGLRPVLFFSPYEAAVWAVVSQRVQGTQAARIRGRMAEELGEVVEIHGDQLHAFPGPDRLIELETFRGLFGRKAEYLRDIAQATLDGRLDAAHLRSLSPDEALRALRALPGIGEFSSGLVLLRGVGMPDATPPREPNFLRALSLAYGVPPDLPDADLHAITDGWQPYRTWVVFLLRRMLSDVPRP